MHLAPAISVLCAGCYARSDRPELAPVAGAITLEGQPLVGATVVFHPDEGKVSRAKTDENGHYEMVYLREIVGAKLGHHKVKITTLSEETRKERLPPKYHQQTELEAVVDEGPNEFDFDLLKINSYSPSNLFTHAERRIS